MLWFYSYYALTLLQYNFFVLVLERTDLENTKALLIEKLDSCCVISRIKVHHDSFNKCGGRLYPEYSCIIVLQRQIGLLTITQQEIELPLSILNSN